MFDDVEHDCSNVKMFAFGKSYEMCWCIQGKLFNDLLELMTKAESNV